MGFERYLAIETAGGAAWHPSQQKIAFVYDAPGHFQVFSVEIKPKLLLWPHREVFDADRCTNPRYLSDGSLMFLKDSRGDENFQIGCLNDSSELTWVTKDRKAKHRPTFLTSKNLYYSANIEDKSVFGVYRHEVPLQTHSGELLFQPEGGVYLTTGANTKEDQLILDLYHGNNNQEIFLFDVETKGLNSLTVQISKTKETRWRTVRMLDNNHLLVITDHQSEYNRFAILSLDGQFETLDVIEEDISYETESTAWIPESPLVYFTLNEDGYNTLHQGLFTINGGVKLQSLPLPYKGVIMHGDLRSFEKGISLSPDGKQVAFTFSSTDKPTNIWILDIQSRKLWQATDSSTAGINSRSFAVSTLQEFYSFDQVRIPYYIHVPFGKMPPNGWPALILVHGGPEAQFRPSFFPIAQFLISGGFALIAPNIRGSSGYGRTFLDLDNIEKRLDSVKDIAHLVKHVNENEARVDAARIAIIGGSYGGFAVLSAMTEYPNLWKAGVDIVGISNFVTFLENTAKWRRKLREVEYGSLETDLETLRRISPIHQLDKIMAPLFIVHGENDERVPLTESLQIHEKLKEKGIPVELLRFSDEGHGITKLQNKIEAYGKILDWLSKIV
ncbi:MAG: prolyl oligopeptidase family serine peptidase [Candidatus Thorarchaeota archaeon]